MSGPRRPAPAERVRSRIAATAGAAVAERLPRGYQRLGRVLVLDIAEELRPHFAAIGRAWQEVLGVATVLRRAGPVRGEWRLPSLETIAGTDTETCVREHGIQWRFDAARVMFARGNRTERARMGSVVRRGETVADLFAGIGYFAVPMAVAGANRVFACEVNPVSYGYLVENARRNAVADRLVAWRGDNRTIEPAAGGVDRVVLGYLPSSVPFTARAVQWLRPEGGTLHVHAVQGTREPDAHLAEAIRREVGRAGRPVSQAHRRRVKAYGPGREHVVWDVEVGAASTAPGA